jgi:hypothetical protein
VVELGLVPEYQPRLGAGQICVMQYHVHAAMYHQRQRRMYRVECAQRAASEQHFMAVHRATVGGNPSRMRIGSTSELRQFVTDQEIGQRRRVQNAAYHFALRRHILEQTPLPDP